MGQRLVVELLENEETKAVVYYHWSAYFGSAIQELRDLCKDILQAQNDKKDVLAGVLDGLEKRGGGIGVNDVNLAEAHKRFPDRTFPKDVSRNCGLMYLGESEIRDTLAMAEGNARIYLDTRDVYCDVTISDYLPLEFKTDDNGTVYTNYNGESINIDSTEMSMKECIRLGEFVDKIYENLIKSNREGNHDEKNGQA